MAVEIERKFRVGSDDWRTGVVKTYRICQAHLTKNGRLSLRIRIVDGCRATLTLKTAGAGIARGEYEYPIPLTDALELIEKREGATISKSRHLVPAGRLTWEVDVFEGENAGLVIAEIELPHTEAAFDRPAWLGDEVTHDKRFYNADLAKRPFSQW